jgi:hypothetical protein
VHNALRLFLSDQLKTIGYSTGFLLMGMWGGGGVRRSVSVKSDLDAGVMVSLGMLVL